MTGHHLFRCHSFTIARTARFGAAALSLLLSMTLPAAAHPSRGDYVQHHTLLRVDPVNIDVEIELVFDDMRAMAERHRMDRDHDWRINDAELRSYAETLTEAMSDQLTLTLDGRPLELIPLHEAEVDLAGQAQVAPRSCTLRSFFFARTGPTFSAGSCLAMVDRLWASAPALCTLRVEGTRGVSLQVTQAGDVFPAAGDGRPRELSAVCLKTPRLKSEYMRVATTAPEASGSSWCGLLTAAALSGVALASMRRKPSAVRNGTLTCARGLPRFNSWVAWLCGTPHSHVGRTKDLDVNMVTRSTARAGHSKTRL